VYVTSSAGQIKLDDFAYRTATPFVELPANEDIRIGVALSTSSSEADTIASFNVMFEAGERYFAVATGVVAGSYNPNPNGLDIGFTILAQDGIKEEAPFGGVYVNGFHGSTDAPMVDIRLRGTFFSYAFFNDIQYGDFGTNFWLLPGSYTLDVTDAANTTVVASYEADLSGLGGSAVFVFASGFLNPAQNGGVAPFGLFVALPDGTVLPLPTAPAPTYDRWALNKEADESELASGSVPRDYALNQNYPNPFNPSTTISFALPQASNVNLTVYNLLGQRMTTLVDGPMSAGNHSVEFDASSYATGVYFYRLTTDGFAEVKKMVLAK
ncbi:MAG: T9SS type A sorting domain-containing protein, partial [candidate division Zixibacteria bacterium]|nr:T9SS type A sorting domain-containing protein [candidate division Zixibacteria bacterium]